MKKKTFPYVFTGLTLLVFLSSQSAFSMSHKGFFGSRYTGPQQCSVCHPGKIDEVMDSAHYLLRTVNERVGFPGGGSHGMIDRFCALVGSNAIVNYTADLGGHKTTSSCGKCHVGKYLPFPDPATGKPTEAQKDGIDCLICHASDGNYDMNGDGVYNEEDRYAGAKKVEVDAQGNRTWHQDRSLRAAESVGTEISTAACYRCHEHGQADPAYKRGTPYEPEHDVHAAAGLKCTDCHSVQGHKMARGSRVSDMHAWERQDVEVDCSNCHNNPHSNAAYNSHTSFIACETCHIPYTSGVARRVWASVYGVAQGPESNIPVWDETTQTFEPYSDYKGTYDQRPSYRWFNGQTSMLAEPVNNAQAWDFKPASKETANAKIYPFRYTVSGMVMDRKGIGMDPEYNANFTMLAAMQGMSPPLIQAGFMRPEGLTEAEKMVLAQYPNLLAFDKEHYLKTGKVNEAVSIGLAKMATLLSGQNPSAMSAEQLIEMGGGMWSGSATGLDLPDNPNDPTYVADMDPTTVTGSFVSLNHAIKKEGALQCQNCHSHQSVLDFKALQYSQARAEQLMSMFDTQVSSWELH